MRCFMLLLICLVLFQDGSRTSVWAPNGTDLVTKIYDDVTTLHEAFKRGLRVAGERKRSNHDTIRSSCPLADLIGVLCNFVRHTACHVYL